MHKIHKLSFLCQAKTLFELLLLQKNSSLLKRTVILKIIFASLFFSEFFQEILNDFCHIKDEVFVPCYKVRHDKSEAINSLLRNVIDTVDRLFSRMHEYQVLL